MLNDSHYKWRHCVIGNILKERIDENGDIRHGCKEFSGGTKVYLYGRYFDDFNDNIDVIGLDRHNKYRVVSIPKEFIENVRYGRAFKPSVVEIMNNWEFTDVWWNDTEEDKIETKDFARRWNENDFLGYKYDLWALLRIIRNGSINDIDNNKISDDVIYISGLDNTRIEGIENVLNVLINLQSQLKKTNDIYSIYINDVQFSNGTIKECILLTANIPENNCFIEIGLDNDNRINQIILRYLNRKT